MPKDDLCYFLKLKGIECEKHLIHNQLVKQFAGTVVLMVQIEETFF